MPYRARMTEAGGRERLTVVDATVTVVVSANDTDGDYELFDVIGDRGSGAPLSRHPWPETYYVLSGTIDVTIGAQHHQLGAGGCVTIPPNAPHEYVVTSDRSQMLVMSTTAAGSRFFADMAANVHLADGPERFVPQIMEVAARHDVTILAGPPS